MVIGYRVDGETSLALRKAALWGLMVPDRSLVSFQTSFQDHSFTFSHSLLSTLMASLSSQGNFHLSFCSLSFSLTVLQPHELFSLKCAKCSLLFLRRGVCCYFFLKYAPPPQTLLCLTYLSDFSSTSKCSSSPTSNPFVSSYTSCANTFHLIPPSCSTVKSHFLWNIF